MTITLAALASAIAADAALWPAVYQGHQNCVRGRELRIKHELLKAMESTMDDVENAAEMMESIVAENV